MAMADNAWATSTSHGKIQIIMRGLMLINKAHLAMIEGQPEDRDHTLTFESLLRTVARTVSKVALSPTFAAPKSKE